MEFYRHGFQGANLADIVAAAGITKGALFHHFDGKQALGYAVLDEVTGPILRTRWLDPLRDTDDPIAAMQDAFRHHAREDVHSGHYLLGCPLNNLAQEMSPLDDGFHRRIDAMYEAWRAGVAAALRKGMRKGTVRRNASPDAAAALIVAAQMGIWGTGKSSGDPKLMQRACESVCNYLDWLRPQ